MIHPAHFIVKESPDLMNASSAAKSFLEAEEAMQKYYASVRPCFFQLPLKDSVITFFDLLQTPLKPGLNLSASYLKECRRQQLASLYLFTLFRYTTNGSFAIRKCTVVNFAIFIVVFV